MGDVGLIVGALNAVKMSSSHIQKTKTHMIVLIKEISIFQSIWPYIYPILTACWEVFFLAVTLPVRFL